MSSAAYANACLRSRLATRYGFLLLAAVLFWHLAAGASAGENWWEAQFGPADVTAISGNGGLTVGVNRYGRLTSCRWPSPGYYDQLHYLTRSRTLPELGVGPEHGAMWALRVAGQAYWLVGPPWQVEHQGYRSDASTVIETNAVLPQLGVKTLQTLFVHPEQDLIVARITVLGTPGPSAVYWFQNFSPCARLIPELPIADWALDALNDFAVFAAPGGERLYHFRPEHTGQEDWERAEALANKASAEGGLPPEWDVFDTGVWIGAATPNRVRAHQCGNDQGPNSARAAIETGRFAGSSSAVGQCHAAYDLIPEDRARGSARAGDRALITTVYIAFGQNRQRVDDILDYAGERGFDCLQRETEAYWRRWLEPAGLTLEESALESTRRRALLTIAQATDRQTGVVVRAPITQPPMALAFARYGAWITLALDMAGYPSLAERNTRFYAEVLRREGRPGMPRGSLPAACYANHVPALPHVILDVDATAWMLGSLWRHAAFLDRKARRDYLESVWDTVDVAADFLIQWKHGVKGEPLHSFERNRLRDTRSVSSQLLILMGLESALEMAAVLQKPAPEAWAVRRRELDTLVRFHLLNDPAPWLLEPETACWLRDVAPQDHPMWRATVKVEGGQIALRNVAFPAGAFLDEPARRPSYPDAAHAAMQFIAATLRLYGGP